MNLGTDESNFFNECKSVSMMAAMKNSLIHNNVPIVESDVVRALKVLHSVSKHCKGKCIYMPSSLSISN